MGLHLRCLVLILGVDGARADLLVKDHVIELNRQRPIPVNQRSEIEGMVMITEYKMAHEEVKLSYNGTTEFKHRETFS